MAVRVLLALLSFAAAAAWGGEPGWRRHTIDDDGRGADGVRLHDADADGDLDIVTGWEEAGVTRMYLNPGAKGRVTGRWPRVDVGRTPDVEDAVMADVDGDGSVDVVSSCEGKTRAVTVHFGPKWAAATFPRSVLPAAQWMYAAPLDVNGDGRADLVVGSKGEPRHVGWVEAPAEGRRDLSKWRYHPIGEAGWVMSIIPSDVDGDGDVDVLLSDRRGPMRGVRWLENPGGDGLRRRWASHAIGLGGEEVMFIDAVPAKPGEPVRIAACAKGDRLCRLRRGDDARTAWERRDVPWPAGVGTAKSVRVGDVNLDGREDFILSFESSGGGSGVVWLEQGPDGEWTRREISGKTGIKFDRSELLDVDVDGDLDVLNTEENPKSTPRGALGVVWYENPTR